MSIIKINTQNFNGVMANVIFSPLTGGTIDIGLVTLPYDYETDYQYGVYAIYVDSLKKTFYMNVPDPNSNITQNNPDDVIPNETLLGREYRPDIRDNNFLIASLLNNIPQGRFGRTIIARYWQDNIWWGNQGNTPMCVGYAWTHWIEDGPILHQGIHPVVSPITIYNEAQKIDEWAGENYDGTSVRAGAKYLRSTNKIQSYYWAYDVNTLISTVLNVGPVVVGTNWYRDMFYPNSNGVIRASGILAGGHAYCINGVDTNTKLFRIKNSWGRNWGKNGYAFISFNDMSRLIRENGEICLAVEKKF